MYTFYHGILDIVSVDIVNGSIEKKDYMEFRFNEETKKSYEDLFDFTVKCIAELIKGGKITKKLPLAFIFPFLESLTSGKLIHWTKATGGGGKKVVQLLKDAVTANGENVSIQ
jgi:hexokinase